MSLRLRLLGLLLVIYCGGAIYLVNRALDEVRPRYLESMVETLVDLSVLLAATLETQAEIEIGGTALLKRAFASAQRREFEATIFTLRKTAIDLRVYVTDRHGRVLFDSTGRDEGQDYSQWNDVRRTLRGEYGARSTRDIPGDDRTQVLYVAAPVMRNGVTIGAVTAGKPTRGINDLVAVAKRRILLGGIVGGAVLLVMLLLAASWTIAPLERLTAYVRAARDRRPAALPQLPGRTLRELGTAFEEMREALEGRQRVERYTQVLAHEVKAPLAAIHGAAELLEEPMPAEQREKFLSNIREEAGRIQQIVERLLELSSLEARKTLGSAGRVEASTLMAEAEAVLRQAFYSRQVSLGIEVGAGLWLLGDRVLLREALVNLLQNALDFTPRLGRVMLRAEKTAGRVEFSVEDNGTGVPGYALPRVFERFYSLPRPESGRKSTGLGLSLVQEIAHLHSGDDSLSNRPEGGAKARLSLPHETFG